MEFADQPSWLELVLISLTIHNKHKSIFLMADSVVKGNLVVYHSQGSSSCLLNELFHKYLVFFRRGSVLNSWKVTNVDFFFLWLWGQWQNSCLACSPVLTKKTGEQNKKANRWLFKEIFKN